MKKCNHFIGADISKQTVDICLVDANDINNSIFRIKVPNSKTGVATLTKQLKRHKIEPDGLLICLEFTGLYSRCFALNLLKYNYNVWLEMPYKIKHSIGLQREKTDKADAKVIAHYACRFSDKAKLLTIEEQKFENLQDLMKQRERLLQGKLSLIKAVQEMRNMDLKEQAMMLEKSNKVAVRGFEKAIEIIEDQIDEYVNVNPEIQKQAQILQSIPAVGKITSLTFIAMTRGFTRVQNSKSLACYCGVAPFAKQSGTSIKGKAKVSLMANRKLKTSLHMCAMRSVRMEGHFKEYYYRKVEEGKNKMLVLNAIRNKIATRMYALIKEDRFYQECLVLS